LVFADIRKFLEFFRRNYFSNYTLCNDIFFVIKIAV